MSLINDALKRARQGEPSTPSQTEPLQPAYYSPTPKLPLILLPLILVAVFGLAGWFLLKGWESARQSSFQPTITVAARTPATAQRPAPAAVVSAPELAAITEPVAIVPPAVPAIEQPPSFPNLKLQAIFFRPSNPTVVINARSLHVGDSIAQAKVISITRDSVVVEWEGEKRTMELP